MLYQLLYVSTLSADQPLSAVAAIAHQARVANARMGITALLVFDGQNFCQLLEGDRKLVLKLIERIRSDPRHTGVEVLHHGPLAERSFSGFRLNFTNGEDDGDRTPLQALEALDGETAVAAFHALRADLPL